MEQDQEINNSTRISEIQPIDYPRVLDLSRDLIPKVVEPPLIEACEELHDRGIKTLLSTANKKDVGYSAGIMIDFASLSEENKKIGEKLGHVIKLSGDTKPTMLRLDFNVSEETTVGDVKRAAKEIVSQFKSQK